MVKKIKFNQMLNSFVAIVLLMLTNVAHANKSHSFKNEKYYFSSNDGVPKKILVPFGKFRTDFLESYYLEILSMLKTTERKWPVESHSFVFTVVYSKKDSYDYLKFENRVREKLGLSMGTDLPNFSSWTGNSIAYDWFQDEGEILYPADSSSVDSFSFLQTGSDDFVADLRENDDSFSAFSVLKLKQGDMDNVKNKNRKTSSRQGGNIETTHEGKVMVGNSMFVESVDYLKELSMKPVFEIDTSWTFIGHVDEQFSFIPAQNNCGTVLAAASPLKALLELIKNENLSDDSFSASANELEINYSKSAIIDSLKYFLKRGERLENVTSIQSFDLKKESRKKDVTRNASPRWGFLEKTGEICPYYISPYNVDTFVRMNLESELKILENFKIIKKNSSCLESIVRIPQLFYLDYKGYCSRDPFQNPLKPSKKTPLETKNAMVNFSVIFDHVFLPRSGIPMFDQITRELISVALGSSEKVHFVDTHRLTYLKGSVHCQSMIIRDLNSIY